MPSARPLAPSQVTALQWLERSSLVWIGGAWRPDINPAVRLRRSAVERLVDLDFARMGREPGGRRVVITHTGCIVAAAYATRRRLG